MSELRNYWGVGNEVRLPRTIRAYFGVGAECHVISEQEKLLELGYCLWRGLNLYTAVKKYLSNHSEHEDSIKNGIANAIERLRDDNSHQGMLTYLLVTEGYTEEGKTVKPLSLKKLVELFSEELLLRYRPHYLVEYHSNYKELMEKYQGMDLVNELLSPMRVSGVPISEQEIRDMNPWKSLYDYVNPVDNIYFVEYANWILKDDYYYIKEFNKANKGDTEFIKNIYPEPFSGNPLTSKVVILSLNPGYIDRINNKLARVMPPQLTEVVKCQLDAQMSLRAKSFMCESFNTPWDVTYREAQNMVGGWYWYDIFENFRKEAGLPSECSPEDVIYDNVSVVQYIGYASKSYKDLPAGLILPSQHFTRLLIHYLALCKKDVLFVVSRSENKWRNLIGEEIWGSLEKENRLVHRKQVKNKNGKYQYIRTQWFTKDSFKDNGFNRIVETSKSK